MNDPEEPSSEGQPAPMRPGPIGGDMASIVYGLGRRLRLPTLSSHHSSIGLLGAFSMINGVISIGIMAAAAEVARQPLVFPSLGPTAFLLFHTPTSAPSSPRNTICGHGIGVVVGYLSLIVFGLADAGPALAEGVTTARVGAAAMSLGLTSGLMVWAKVPHPPAGATTLIISLGIITRPVELAVLMVAVVLLVLQGFLINRLAGIDYPLWAPRVPSG